MLANPMPCNCSVVRSHISSGRNGGSVRQAFSAALQQEVADLYQLLALLERQLAHKPPAPGREASDGECCSWLVAAMQVAHAWGLSGAMVAGGCWAAVS